MSEKHFLTLGPVYYLWKPERWRDFYLKIADEAPIDRVVIGETICSKRAHFTDAIFDDVACRLQAAGKEVVLSSLAVITLERELKVTRAITTRRDFLVEANDLAAINLLKQSRFTIGPLVNVYNGATARFYSEWGAEAICLPPELPLSSIVEIAKDKTSTVDVEVFTFGRLPLALSARCAHARAKGHIKDNCQFICADDPNGLAVKTIDGKDFLSLNGIQTMSHSCQALTYELKQLIDAGVRRFRLSPQVCDMVAVAKVYADILNENIPAEEGHYLLQTLCGDMPLSNGFTQGVEGARWVERSVPTGH